MLEISKHWAGPAVPPSADELRDHYALSQLAKIYALGIDVRNLDLCRSAFSPEATGEGRGQMLPLEDFLKTTYGVGASFHATQHLIANQYIQVQGDDADVWSYGIAHHKVAPGEAKNEIIAGVIYRDRCHRFAKGWLITERRLTTQWVDMAPARAASTAGSR
jgi:hypothetical protein